MILVFVLNCPVYAQNKSIDEINREMRIKGEAEKADKIKALLKSRDTDISFYGKVQDQYGQAISNAKIVGNKTSSSVMPPYFKDIKTISTDTDSSGNFNYSKLTGLSLYFETIEKEGYTFNPEGQKISFDYSGLQEKNKFQPDPTNPIVFILHKKSDPGYVEERYDSKSIFLLGQEFEVDLNKGILDSERKIITATGDMIVSVVPGLSKDSYNISISTRNNDDLLIEQDGDAHIAPENGAYKHTITYELRRDEKIIKNIYFKSLRDNVETYARLQLKLEIKSTGIACDVNLYTSLDGSRNLEEHVKFLVEIL